MATLDIQPDRLKTIRTARQIERGKLAELSGLSEQEVADLETPEGESLDANIAFRIAQALNVPLPTLTGDLDVIEADLQPRAASKCSCCP